MNLAAIHDDGAADRWHVPVMVEEVCGLLSAHGPHAFVDVTVGAGGHSEAILRATEARMLGIDRDATALVAAKKNLAEFGDRVVLHQGDFGEIATAMAEHGFAGADAILADLGMSSLALDDPERGFSFRNDGPLDMRMDQSQELRARDLVNEESEVELARIIYTYGEERASRRIARLIVEARRRGPIETTGELRAIVERALGAHRRGGAHPATRTFQALRIAVNREMDSLAALLRDGPTMLNPGGRMLVISYHSLEDRPVKEHFRELARGGEYVAIARKVIKPTSAETSRNPRSRSARLRCIERRTVS
jgi:16S rRNA (cytosine1402-N4)-methyltransferase